ncbi:hypothetical protein JCM3775_003463 [Rhodotorula graminis]
MTLQPRRPPPAHTPDPRRRPSAPLDPPQPRPLPPHLQDLEDALTRKLDDLDNYQVPQLASCHGPLAFHHELAAAVRSELATSRRDIEEFKLEVDDLERARDRAAAAQHVHALQQRIDSSTKLYRQAVVTSKRQIDAYGHLAARDELLAPAADSSGRAASPGPYGAQGARARSPQPNQSADDALMSATSDVTEGLRRTLQLMQQEVDRSLVSNELLESQTKTMELTSNQYSTLSSLLHTSRALITALERSAVLDRLVLFGAFAFFAAVCAHIFKKRVIDRGVHVLGAVGSVVGAVGRRAGAASAGAAVVDKAGEVVEAAGGAVKDEAKGEIARAAAAAGALAGAAWRGAEALRARAFPHEDAGEEGGEYEEEEEEELAQGVVPAREEGDSRVRAEPVQPSASLDVDEDEDTFDVFHDVLEAVDDDPAPTAAEPLPIPTAEPAPAPASAPLPSPSSDRSPEPTAQLPLADIPTSHGDSAADPSDVPPPAPLPLPTPAEVEPETVALREERPPTPSVDAQDAVAFEPVPTPEAAPVEQDEQDELAHEPVVANDDDERVFQPLERLRPTRPDLDAQLGDVQGIVDAHASGAHVQDEVDEVLPIVDEDAALELDEQAHETAITAPEPSGMASPVEEQQDDDSGAATLPVDDDAATARPAPGLDLAAAKEAQHVAEAHAGGEGGTRVPEADELREGGLPRLDVDGDEPVVEDEDTLDEVELPVDLEKEQTAWKREGEQEEEPVAAAERDKEQVDEEEQSGEALLDEMLEAQLGGVIGGAAQHVVGSMAGNDTASFEHEPAVAPQQDEPAAVADPAPNEAAALPLDEPFAAFDDFPLDDTTSLPEPAAAAIPEDAPSPASTAATTAEPTPAASDSPLDAADAPLLTAEPTISAAPVVSSELDDEQDEVAPPPAAEAEESAEPAQASSTGASAELDDDAAARAALEEEREEDAQLEEGSNALEDEFEDDEIVGAPLEETDLPLVRDDQGDDDSPSEQHEQDSADAEVGAAFDDLDHDEPALPLDVELPLHDVAEEHESHEGGAYSDDGEGDRELELEEDDLASPNQLEADGPLDQAELAPEASAPHDVVVESGEYALGVDELDADIANSDVVFPDSSIDEDDSADSASSPSSSPDDDVDDQGAVFESAADEAAAEHVGEQAPAPGHEADEALQRAEDLLDELEYDPEDGEEYYDGEGEGEWERFEGEEEGEPYYEEEEAQAPVERDEL